MEDFLLSFANHDRDGNGLLDYREFDRLYRAGEEIADRRLQNLQERKDRDTVTWSNGEEGLEGTLFTLKEPLSCCMPSSKGH